jgi:hypothetical protein
VTRGFQATDELDDHVDRGIGNQGGGVVGEQLRRDVVRPLTREVVDGDASHLEAGAALDGQGVGTILDDADERRPYVPASEDGNSHNTFERGRRGHPVTLPPVR